MRCVLSKTAAASVLGDIYHCCLFTIADKKSSLFDLNAVWTPDNVQLLLHRLTDPYESNKVMAFDLLSNLPQETLGLMVGVRKIRRDIIPTLV